jgi:protein O-mannosyl-transferase
VGFFNTYPMRYAFVADHFQYAAGIALIALVVAMLRRRAPILTVAIAIFGVLTWQRAHAYANPEALWRDTIAKNGSSWMARHNLGVVLSSRGDERSLHEALRLFDEVERLRPQHEHVDLSRAVALSRMRRWDDAIQSYRNALARLGPPTNEPEARRVAGIHDSIGVAQGELGRREDAEASYRRAIEVDPRFRDPYAHLADLYERDGRAADAVALYEKLLGERPNDPPTLLKLARLLDRMGRHQEAIARYRAYSAANPDDANALVSLGLLLGLTGQFDEAIQVFTKALAIDPELSAARDGLHMAIVAKRQAAASRPAVDR